MSRRVLVLLGLAPFGFVRPPDVQRLERVAADPGRIEVAPPLPGVFEGIVFDSNGAPAPGVSVASSAGGHAITDRNGKYRLEVAVPVEAHSVEITAIGGVDNELVATTSVSFAGRSGVTWLQPIELREASTCQPSWRPTFGGTPGATGTVYDLVEFDDGSGPALYAAGDFGEILGLGVDGLAKWDGTNWSEVETEMTASVGSPRIRALEVFDNGSGPALYAGGNFNGMGGVAANNVAKWDGSSWTALGSGVVGVPPNFPASPEIFDLAVFDDGNGPELYAGGLFTTAGGVLVNHIAKWNGSSWSALGSGVSAGFNGFPVHALTVFDDGNGAALYVGGALLSAGGVAANRIAKWNGSSWSKLGSGISGGSSPTVYDLTVFDDGGGPELYVGGEFSSAGGAAANSFAKWNGTVWTSLTTPANSRVHVLEVLDNGKGQMIYGAGFFPGLGGGQADRIARWNGSSWDVLADVDGGFISLNALAEFDGGGGSAIFIGGNFDTVGGTPAHKIAKWDGASWSTVGRHGLNPWVEALTVFDDGTGPALYAGGPFNFLQNNPFGDNQVARWNGSSWTVAGKMNNRVSALAVFDDGSGPALFAAGSFSLAGGVAATRIARWNGSSWNALGSGISGAVLAMTVFDDGGGQALYAGGQFTTAGGTAASAVAEWNGSTWSGLGSGMGPSGALVEGLAVHDDGSGAKLYAGGTFTTAGGQAANRIARWDGSSWTPLGSGMDGTVEALAVFDDGNGPALYAGGAFLTAGGVAANHIAKWNGTSWEPLGLGLSGGSFSDLCMTVFDDGSGPALYVGGGFSMAGDVATNRIAKWDGSSWSPLGAGIGTSTVLSLAVFNDRTGAALHAAGFFAQSPGGDAYLAKWGCPDTSAPVITCPEAILIHDHGAPGEVVTFQATVEDAEDYQPSVVFTPPSGSHFPRGTTFVTCTATDAAGNQATCQFPVTVVRAHFREIEPQSR